MLYPGLRIDLVRTKRRSFRTLPVIHILAILTYFLSCAFILSAGVLFLGFDLSTSGSCTAAIYICLVFYFSSKMIMQLFLIERIHLIRKHEYTRLKDYLWLGLTSQLVIAYCTFAVVALYYAISDYNVDNGGCRIGLPDKVLWPMAMWDLVFDVFLTMVFYLLLRPVLKIQKRDTDTRLTSDQEKSKSSRFGFRKGSAVSVSESSVPAAVGLELGRRDVTRMARFIRAKRNWIQKVLWKSLFGTIISMVAVAINVSIMLSYHGLQPGWMCLISCTTDGKPPASRVKNAQLISSV